MIAIQVRIHLPDNRHEHRLLHVLHSLPGPQRPRLLQQVPQASGPPWQGGHPYTQAVHDVLGRCLHDHHDMRVAFQAGGQFPGTR